MFQVSVAVIPGRPAVELRPFVAVSARLGRLALAAGATSGLRHGMRHRQLILVGVVVGVMVAAPSSLTVKNHL